jgi:hypothetical protein
LEAFVLKYLLVAGKGRLNAVLEMKTVWVDVVERPDAVVNVKSTLQVDSVRLHLDNMRLSTTPIFTPVEAVCFCCIFGACLLFLSEMVMGKFKLS